MSAFLVSKAHIDALVFARSVCDGPGAVRTARELSDDELGRKFLRENMLSLASRYNDPVDEAEIRRYRYDYMAGARVASANGAPRVVALIKAFHCFEYQACEHREWSESETKAICDRIVSGLCHRLEGYDAAPWGFDDAPPATPVRPMADDARGAETKPTRAAAAVKIARAIVAKLEAPARPVVVHEAGKPVSTGFVSFKNRDV